MNNVASVKDRLKNRSIATGKTVQELLTAYGLERTLYRLCKSNYAGSFTLKGGIFLYAVFDGNYSRATTDIDLLAHKISNDEKDMKRVFMEIFSLDADDPFRFDLDTLEVHPITEFKDYHGVNVSIMAYLDRTRIPISIDIGFGDVIVPGRVIMDFPVILSDECLRIYAYSLCSSVAEKFEAIVSLAYDNSRFKDYYDLYALSITHDFNGTEMTEAVRETFKNRHSSLNEIVAFEEGFADDPLRQSRWNAFVRRKRAMLPIRLSETIIMIQKLMQPVAEAVMKDSKLEASWSHEQQIWI